MVLNGMQPKRVPTAGTAVRFRLAPRPGGWDHTMVF